MARKRYTPEQIIAKLREADVRLAAGEKTKAICRSLGIAEQTDYRWRRRRRGDDGAGIRPAPAAARQPDTEARHERHDQEAGHRQVSR